MRQVLRIRFVAKATKPLESQDVGVYHRPPVARFICSISIGGGSPTVSLKSIKRGATIITVLIA